MRTRSVIGGTRARSVKGAMRTRSVIGGTRARPVWTKEVFSTVLVHWPPFVSDHGGCASGQLSIRLTDSVVVILQDRSVRVTLWLDSAAGQVAEAGVS